MYRIKVNSLTWPLVSTGGQRSSQRRSTSYSQRVNQPTSGEPPSIRHAVDQCTLLLLAPISSAAFDMSTSHRIKVLCLQVMKCSIDANGVLSDQVSSEAISATIRQQLNIDLAPQLISIPEPFTELGQRHAMLQMTLPDGNRPLLQIHLTEP